MVSVRWPTPEERGRTWWDGRMVCFDLETTSADPEQARIVQIAAALVGGGEPTEKWTLLVDPGVPIPEEATSIHGITDEMVHRDGVPAADALVALTSTLYAWLAPYAQTAQPRPLVAFNMRYDLTVADRECRRHGLAAIQEMVVPLFCVDPFVLDAHLHKYRKGSRKLADQCDYWARCYAEVRGLAVTPQFLARAHDAHNDAVATARMAWLIGKAGKVVRRVRDWSEDRELDELQEQWLSVRDDLPALHEAQRGWAEKRQAEFREYFMDKGLVDRAAEVREGWPMIEVGATR